MRRSIGQRRAVALRRAETERIVTLHQRQLRRVGQQLAGRLIRRTLTDIGAGGGVEARHFAPVDEHRAAEIQIRRRHQQRRNRGQNNFFTHMTTSEVNIIYIFPRVNGFDKTVFQASEKTLQYLLTTYTMQYIV